MGLLALTPPKPPSRSGRGDEALEFVEPVEDGALMAGPTK